jgi:hypothetical protein
MAEYSNQDFGFGSSAYGEPTPQKQEEKIAKSASTPAKIQRAAVTAVAPAVEAASASAPEAVAPPLPPLPTASAGAPPAIQNPVQTADFWSSALKGVGIPVGIGLAAGAAGGLLAKRSGGGGSPAGSVAPTVDEDLRQLRLAQEQAKLDAIYEKNYRQQQLHEANLAKMQPQPSAAAPTAQAGMPSTSQQFSVQQTPVDYSLTPAKAYGQQNLNVPTGAPNVAAPPPAEVAPAAVAPKPVSEIERLRIEKAQFDLEAARAKEARAAELHASRLAADAKRAEAKNQTKQGTPTQSLETTMQKQSYENTVSKAVDADMKAAAAKKAPPAASVVPPAAPAVTAPVATAPSVPPVATTLTKEQKGMKNYLVSQYGGGPEGEAAYKKTIDILGEVPAYEKGQGGGLSKEANDTIKAWRKENIEGPKVNLTHDMKKVMKGAGGAGILMALPGFAEAAQRKDMGKMSDIFTDFFVLPFAQSREAGMSKREEESIIANKFKEASKLGSPYRSVPPPR